MRRAHSVHEMKQKLGRRSEKKLLVQVVMARLKENGMIDDAKYAKQFARQRTQIRKQGKYRVARDLRARGNPRPATSPPHSKRSPRLPTKPPWSASASSASCAPYRGEIDEKKMASIYGSLLRAGFSADVVRRELKALVKEDVPEIEPE